jgi:hypothetical protein
MVAVWKVGRETTKVAQLEVKSRSKVRLMEPMLKVMRFAISNTDLGFVLH